MTKHAHHIARDLDQGALCVGHKNDILQVLQQGRESGLTGGQITGSLLDVSGHLSTQLRQLRARPLQFGRQVAARLGLGALAQMIIIYSVWHAHHTSLSGARPSGGIWEHRERLPVALDPNVAQEQ